jgi:RND family efflux transporter MFP subunit
MCTRIISGLLALFLPPFMAGCSSQPPPAAEQRTISVSLPIVREVQDFEIFTARTAPVETVQVRARVSGYLDKINFKDGAEVEKGAVLYEIDPRPYKAALDQAQAQVKLQEAQLRYQESLFNRNLGLYGKASESLEEVQQSRASRDTSAAQVEAAKANLTKTQLDLNWTKVEAPISGLLSRTLLTRGNLVVADQTLLTTLVTQDPIYAYFDVDEHTVLTVRDLIRAGKLPTVREHGTQIPVRLGLSTEQDYPHEGFVDFVNNQFQASTATLQLRATFPNPKPKVGVRLLAPGMFVRVQLTVSPLHKAILVSQSAVGTDQDLKYVLVLNEQNQVIRRDVRLGQVFGGLQEITRGVAAGERVVIEGLQHAKPGSVIEPRLVPMPVPDEAASPTTSTAHTSS